MKDRYREFLKNKLLSIPGPFLYNDGKEYTFQIPNFKYSYIDNYFWTYKGYIIISNGWKYIFCEDYNITLHQLQKLVEDIVKLKVYKFV